MELNLVKNELFAHATLASLTVHAVNIVNFFHFTQWKTEKNMQNRQNERSNAALKIHSYAHFEIAFFCQRNCQKNAFR